jgi:general secretion pathway protein M
MAIRMLDRLNPRERRLVTALGVILGCGAVVAIPISLESMVHAREADNQELYTALTAVQDARALVHERQEKREVLLQRYAKKAPPLAGFIEQAAQKEKLEVTDSVDRPDVPHGKKYLERSTTVHLKKSGLLPIAKFLETLETSGYPVEVSRLALRKRVGEQDSYDVEVGVSAYDRSDAVAAPPVVPLPSGMPSGAPGMPFGAPGVPGPAGLPGVPGMPGAAPLPGIPGMPGGPPLPGIPGMPGGPPLPGVPGVVPPPGMPGVPGAAPLPGVPGVVPSPAAPGVPAAASPAAAGKP